MPEETIRQRLLREAAEAFDFELGNAALVLGRCDEAVQLYGRALQTKVDHAAALYNLGKALRVLGRHGEAEDAVRRAMAGGPAGPAAACIGLARTYELHNRKDEAVAAYEEALSHQPDHPEAILGLFLIASDRPDVDARIALYEKAISLPEDILPARSHSLMVSIYMVRERYEEARSAVNRGLAENPGNPDVLLMAGIIHQALDEHEAARSLFEKAEELHPKQGNFPFFLSYSLRRLGFADAALAAAERAVAGSPQGAHDLLFSSGLAFSLQAAGRQEDAVACLERAIAVHPHSPWPRLNLAVLLAEAGRSDQAEPVVREGIAADPALPWGYLLLGRVLRALGRSVAAAAAVRDGMQRAPSLGNTFGWLPQIHVTREMLDQAPSA